MSKRMKKARRVSVGILAAAVSGALCGSAGDAAVMMDLRVIGATGAIGDPTDKAVTLAEGGTVTVGVYVKGLAPSDFGIGGFQYSVRSFNETHNNGALWPVNRTPSDTVVNATARTLDVPLQHFTAAPTPGSLADINAAIGNPDPSDTDIDVFNAGANQQDGQAAGYIIGLGVGDTWYQLGTATFTALDMDDATRLFNRAVHLNLYFTSTSATNGGVMIKGLINGNTDDSNSVAGANLITGSSQIGAPVIVTVAPLVTGNNSKLWVGPTEPTGSMEQTNLTVNFGRVMKGSAAGGNVNLNKNGSDTTTATVVASGDAIYGGTSPINIGAGDLLIPIPVGVDTSTVGNKAGQVVIDNQATTSSGVSRGSDNGNANINISGTVVEQRVVTAGPVDLGRVMKGSTVSGSFVSMFTTAGADSERTRITVNGQLFNGPMSVPLPVAGSAPNVQNSGVWASLPVTPEGLPGEGTYANVVVNYNAEAVEKRQVSINAGQVLPVDVGGGNLLAGRTASLSGSVLLDSPGTHAEKTDVLVGGTLFNDNIVAFPKNFSVSVTASNTGVALIPVVTAENGGVGLPGEGTYPDVAVPWVAHVGEALAKKTNNYGEFGPALTGRAGATYAGLSSQVVGDAGGTGGAPLLGSEAKLLAGTASDANTVVSMKWRSRSTDPYLAEDKFLLSDVVDLTGIAPIQKGTVQTDVFVLQMSYDERLIPVLFDGLSELELAQRGMLFLGSLYLGEDGELGGTGPNHDWWVNAVSLNFGPQDRRFMGIGPWAGDMTLGHYGVDIDANVVWAVVNHNSQFAVVPEPSGLLLGIAGLAMLGFVNWRRHRRSSTTA